MALVFPDGSRTINPTAHGGRFDTSQYQTPASQQGGPIPPFISVSMGRNTRTMVPNPEYGRLHGLEWDGGRWVKANPNADLERKAAEMALEQARWRMEMEKEKAERERLEWQEQYNRDFSERLRESAVPMPGEQSPEQIRAAQLRQVAIDQANAAKRQANLDRSRQMAMENSGRFNPGPGPQAGTPKIGPVGPVDDAGRPLPKPGQAQPITGPGAEDPRLKDILAQLQAEYPDIPVHQLMEAAKQMLEEMRNEQEQDFYSKFPGKRPVSPPRPAAPSQTPPAAPSAPPAFNPSGPVRQLFKPGHAQPVQPPAQGTPYGTLIGQGGPASADFVDTDADNVDDRYQRGPGQPMVDPRKPMAGWRRPPRPGDKPLAPPKPGMTY